MIRNTQDTTTSKHSALIASITITIALFLILSYAKYK